MTESVYDGETVPGFHNPVGAFRRKAEHKYETLS